MIRLHNVVDRVDPYKKIVGFRDVYFRKYAYDLADSGLSTVLYDNDYLKEISDWLDTAAYIIFDDSNSLVWKYVHDGKVFKPRITPKMCDTLCRKDESYLIWHNILLSILPMYNDKIAKLHISRYEYSLPLSKRLCDMTGSDERFIRSLLTYITDHVEYEGKSIRTFQKLKQGYWECLPLQNRMELYNCIEALIENNNLHKYMLIDSYKDTAQRVLRLYNKLLEPGYYRICLKMDMMMNGIFGNQCKSSEEAGEAIREYERRINEVYDYFLENVELSANQIEKNVTAQLDAAFSAKDNAEAISEKASPVLPAVLEGENLTTQFEAVLSGKHSEELSADQEELNIRT